MKKLVCAVFFAIIISSVPAWATPIHQYATSVIGFSSQFSVGSWSAEQALFAPDTVEYGDIRSAWAPDEMNGTLEFITLGYELSTYATGATIRETDGNGFVYQVDVLDTNDVLHTVWTGMDPSLPGDPADYLVTWDTTPYLVKGLKIYTDTSHNLGEWEEIDAVQLHGSTDPGVTPVPEPATFALLGIGLAGIAVFRHRIRKPSTLRNGRR